MANLTREQINATIEELSSYVRMQTELEATIESLKDQIKAYMTDEDLSELMGAHGEKIYWKTQVQTRFDKTSFVKAGYQELYDSFTKKSEVKPFKFYN